MTDRMPEIRHARRAALWVGVIIPLALTIAASVIVIVALPQLPAQVVTQYAFSGAPNSFGPAWTQLVLSLGIGGLLSLISLWTLRAPAKNGQAWSPGQRFIAALMLGCVAMIQIISVGTTLLQAGLTDARDMANPTPILLAALVSWPVLTLIGYVVQPKLVVESTTATASEPLRLARGERVVWVGVTALNVWLRAVIWAIPLILVSVAAALLLLGDANWWIPLPIATIMVFAALIGTSYRVRIDRTGLTARTPLGWPTFTVPAVDIATVTVDTINPMGEFGGWGLRSMPGAFGLVLSSGPGLRIRRKNGRMFVITLNDADTAASVLAAAAEQRS